MRQTLVLLGILGLMDSLGCRTGVSTPARPRLIDSTSFPARWSPSEVADALREFAARQHRHEIPGDPEIGSRSPTLFTASTQRSQVRTDAFHVLREGAPIEKGARGERVEVHDLWLRRSPTAVITPDGELSIRVETLRPMAGGRLSVGSYVYGPVLRQPILRAAKPLKMAGRPGQTHFEARYPLTRLLQADYDIQGARQTGRGQFIYRIQVLDPKTGEAHLDDGRVYFRCRPLPCDRGARFVQLPTMVLGPFVDLVDSTGATISFVTDVPTSAEIWVRSHRETLTRVRGAPGGTTQHEIRLAGLQPGDRHRYMVL